MIFNKLINLNDYPFPSSLFLHLAAIGFMDFNYCFLWIENFGNKVIFYIKCEGGLSMNNIMVVLILDNFTSTLI